MFDVNVASQQVTQSPSEPNVLIEHPLIVSGNDTSVLEQHDVRLDSDRVQVELFYVQAQALYQFLQGCVLTASGHPTSSSEHRTDQYLGGISTHAHSLFRIPARDLMQFLKRDAFPEQPSFTGGNETSPEQNGTPFYSASWLIPATDLYKFLQFYVHPASAPPPSGNGLDILAEQNDMPADDPLFLIPAESMSRFLQIYEFPGPSSFVRGDEIPTVQQLEDCSENDSTSRSVTPTRSQDSDDEVDAEPDEATASICPVCREPFRRVQERNRHIESYLPHSIYCPFQGCTWTGRRQWDLKKHWRMQHPETDQAPGECANEIYDPKDFVKSVVDGTPVEEVARSAFAKVQECLGGLGIVGTKVLGRNRDLRKWILIHSSQLN